MKITILSILLFLGIESQSQTKKALLIGIGTYSKEANCVPLNGDKDIDLMRSSVYGMGFKPSNIMILPNESATKAGIENQLQLLEDSLMPGDIVLIHYAGHGRQLVDDDINNATGIREEVDGQDEAILCYDGGLIRDDQIDVILKKIRVKIGKSGQLIVLFDCCFSGTMSRGTDNEPEKNKPVFEEFKGNTQTGEANQFFFSSVSSSGKSQQNNGVGILTEAFSKAIRYPNRTYFELMARIQEEIAKKPNSPNNPFLLPTFEGNGSAVIFESDSVKQEFFFEIQKIDPDDKHSIIINGGKFANIFEKTEIGLFPIGTYSTKGINPIYTGVVSKAEYFTSKVVFKDSLDLETIKSYWVFVTKPSFDDYRIKVAVESADSLLLATLSKKYPLLKITTKIAESELSIGNEGAEKVLIDNKRLKIIKKHQNADSLLSISQIYARAQILKRLDAFNHPNYRIAVEIIPISGTNADLRDSLNKGLYLKGNIPTFDTTMKAIIKVTNLGDKACYFSLINISSTGTVDAVLPSEEIRKYDMVLQKKGSIYISDDIFSFSSPYGEETLIGFATKKVVNLSPIVNASFQSNRGDDSPLNALINSVYGGTRGPSELDSQKMEGSIYKYYYRIVAK